jgi:hypothetical protein
VTPQAPPPLTSQKGPPEVFNANYDACPYAKQILGRLYAYIGTSLEAPEWQSSLNTIRILSCFRNRAFDVSIGLGQLAGPVLGALGQLAGTPGALLGVICPLFGPLAAWFCLFFRNAHWMFQFVLGRCLNRCWAAPGHSWASIGRSWTPMLGCSWTLWGFFGAALMPVLGAHKPLWGILGALLGAIWHSRTIWDPCGAHLRLRGNIFGHIRIISSACHGLVQVYLLGSSWPFAS